ncbi:hypothetical protein VR46_00160 [Streptomyces sp. NRRL S-444]|nr:hypothetical protein VR46_00160 [Streptomyces sp. NRRL S-444]
MQRFGERPHAWRSQPTDDVEHAGPLLVLSWTVRAVVVMGAGAQGPGLACLGQDERVALEDGAGMQSSVMSSVTQSVMNCAAL